MKEQINTQLKVMALQTASGDLALAKEMYAWLSEDNFEAEVQSRLARLKDESNVVDFTR